jgi:hypothetical protein
MIVSFQILTKSLTIIIFMSRSTLHNTYSSNSVLHLPNRSVNELSWTTLGKHKVKATLHFVYWSLKCEGTRRGNIYPALVSATSSSIVTKEDIVYKFLFIIFTKMAHLF